MSTKIPIALFHLGRVVATPTALHVLAHEEITQAIARHRSGDWGELDQSDLDANNRALEQGARLFSVYHGKNGIRFYIITEADRSVTTILLPEDY